MGGSSSKEKETKILNSTTIQSSMKQINEQINNMTMSVIQKNLMKTAASATIKQEVKVKGVIVAGDVNISNVNQSAQVEISVSSLQDSDLKQDLITDTMNDMSAKLKEAMDASASGDASSGDQMIGAIAGAVSDMGNAAAATGGADISSSEKTNVQNIMNVSTETELVNKIESSITSDIMNETVSEISNQLEVDQSIGVEDSVVGGSINITNIDQEVLSSQMLEAISKVGTGSKIMAKMANVSEATIQKALTSETVATTAEIGTLTEVGGVVESVGTAIGGIVGALSNPFVLMAIIGVIGIGAFVMLKKKGGEEGQFQQGGGKFFVVSFIGNLLKNIIKIIRKNLKMLMKFIKKIHVNTVLQLIALVLVVKYIFRIKENFTAKSLVHLQIGDRFVKKSGNKLCTSSFKKMSNKFDISFIKTGKTADIFIVSKDSDNKVFYFRFNKALNQVQAVPYDFGYDSEYKFSFAKSGDKYLIHQGKNYLTLDKCISLTTDKKNASKFSMIE